MFCSPNRDATNSDYAEYRIPGHAIGCLKKLFYSSKLDESSLLSINCNILLVKYIHFRVGYPCEILHDLVFNIRPNN